MATKPVCRLVLEDSIVECFASVSQHPVCVTGNLAAVGLLDDLQAVNCRCGERYEQRFDSAAAVVAYC